MEPFLIRLRTAIHKDLSESGKWIILIGLYVLYRFMAAVYDNEPLTFLVIPLVFIGLCILLADWLIDPMIEFVHLIRTGKRANPAYPPVMTLAIGMLFLLSPLVFILFYFWENVILINAALFAILTAGLISKWSDRSGKDWTKYLILIILLTGMAGLVHAFLLKNWLNPVSFAFYIIFFAFYIFLAVTRKKETEKTEP